MSGALQAVYANFRSSGVATYIEDVFSTWLYTGNGSTQTITNGIDLSGKGGLVWTKKRNFANRHYLFDTNRGAGNFLNSDATNAQIFYAPSLTSFNSNGFTLGAYDPNDPGDTEVSWTFREQPKFFDIVTWTGTGANRTIAHNLGSIPGCIIVKRTDTTADWQVYHRSLANTQYLVLNSTAAVATGATRWNSTTPTSSVFSLGTDATVNASGGTYVAYIYAHDAGGFGLSGTDNVISCGSFTTDGSGLANVTLGYEPQWLMYKSSSGVGDWTVDDTMRGWKYSSPNETYLLTNSDAKENTQNVFVPKATGFGSAGSSGGALPASTTYIYIAIRRPMKTPTTGTEVFIPLTTSGTAATRTLTSNFVVDLDIAPARTGSSITRMVIDRLRGRLNSLSTNLTDAESNLSAGYGIGFDLNNGVIDYISTNNVNAHDYVNYLFRRAAGFFDVVCYTGTGGASQTFTHNLGVAPELVIVKCRNSFTAWESLGTALSASRRQIYLNRTAAGVPVGVGHLGWNGTDGAYKAPTSSVVYFGGDSDVGGSGLNYVAYLFATVAGVSKVGSYTGTGATLSINAGFTTGARFVMIKRTDSTGNWFVWDTARGMVAGTDPSLALNDIAAESNANWVYTTSTGFQIVTTDASVNASGGTYIYLAIA